MRTSRRRRSHGPPGRCPPRPPRPRRPRSRRAWVEAPGVAGGAAIDGGLGRGADAASGAVVRPNITRPAARRRAVMWRRREGAVREEREPWWEGQVHGLGAQVLEEEGHAAEGPRGRPARIAARAASSWTRTTALRAGLRRRCGRGPRRGVRRGGLRGGHQGGEARRVVIVVGHGGSLSGEKARASRWPSEVPAATG
jgi:hypothetical protein